MAPDFDAALSLSAEEKHRLYTEHSPEALAAIERVLAAPGPSPVLILSGGPGCGRTGLLEAAASRGAGRVLPLDLEGYEEGLGLGRFAEVQIARRWELDEDRREELGRSLAPLLPRIAPSLPGAAVVSLLLRLGDPESYSHLFTDGADPREALASLLRLLSRDPRLVLHVVASPQLNDPLRRRLLAEAGSNSGLVLALSCPALETDERVAPRMDPSIERLRFELQPLPAGDLVDEVKDLVDDLDLETADRLQRLLDLAALCGGNMPAEILFHHLEIEEEEQEELLDIVDEDLADAEDPLLFVDLQYGHPSFPGLLTYSFLSPRVNESLLEPLTADKRRRMAAELLDFVDRSIPLHTRGMALLRLALAEHAGDAERWAANARDLRVWIGEDEVEELTASLAQSVAEGSATIEELLSTAQETEGRWPPHCRLAFVEAAGREPDRLTPSARAAYRFLRARLLREMSRRPEALDDARTALEAAREVYGPESPQTVDAMTLLGIVLREEKQPEEARLHLERALELGSRTAPEDPQQTAALANLLSSLGLTLYDLGQRGAAREHLLQALALHRQIFGDVHPAVASDLRNLAVFAREQGEARQALEYLRPIVDILRQIYGDVHPGIAQALIDVASLLRELGETEGARLHLEAALQIDQQAYGETHPQVVADLNNLAVVERDLGELDAARDHFEQALALAEASVGPDHVLTVQLRRAIGGE